jgi:hypothetical protein
MSHRHWIALAFLSLAANGCGDAKKARVLYLFHTNDEHSHILGEGPELDENGVTLLDINTSELITPEQAIVKRPDGSEVKEWEALAWFVKRESAANGGTLPARYDKARTQYPRRMICAGPLCKPL